MHVRNTAAVLLNVSCTATSIPFIYSFSGNSAASAPISTFTCLSAIYIFPGSVYIFPPAEQADPSWGYIIRSQTHECGNLDWGPRYSFPWNICFKFSAFCLCSVCVHCAVLTLSVCSFFSILNQVLHRKIFMQCAAVKECLSCIVKQIIYLIIQCSVK